MKILLFGGGSRLGTALRRVLPHHIFITPSRTDVDMGNVETLASYVADQGADFAINCIAYNNMDGAETESTTADLINGVYAGNLAEATAQANVPLIHFSTDCEFDGTKEEGYTETDAPNPISAYGRSKALGSKLVQEKNPYAYVVRVSRLFGKPGDSPNAKRSFVEIILDQASKEPAFEVNDAEVSSPTYVDDIARHVDVHLLSKRPAPGTYHIANAGGATWYQWAKAIVELKKLPNEIKPRVPTVRPAKRPAFSVLHSTKIPQMRPWHEALAEYLNA